MRFLGQPSDCPICGHSLLDEGERLVGGARAREWFQPHCQTNHPDYLAWKQSKRPLSHVLGAVTAAVVVGLILFAILSHRIPPPTNRSGGAVLGTAALLAYATPSVLMNRWGIRKFRREWQARGGLPG